MSAILLGRAGRGTVTRSLARVRPSMASTLLTQRGPTMAMHNTNSTNTASSTPSNNTGQSASINQPPFERRAFEFDKGFFKEHANDPEILDPQNSNEDLGYRIPTHRFQFRGLAILTESRTAVSAAAIKPDKPYNDCPSRKVHNEQQRTLWQQIREEAEKDDNIPTALFSPPRTYVEVRVSKYPMTRYCCPCSIEETDCEAIKIRAPKDSPDGITKSMFIQQVSDALYGRGPEADGDGDSESDGYKIGGEEDRPVVEKFDYMLGPGDDARLMGHIFALTRGIVTKQQA
ncbi:uncharacterized protein F4807DRAFT_328077 [Annulohypoxylon truncatum]|uniref:uncharacterized protein n=1 Tax=Annulohypoxylon truncatum TaxID=327061 RepID=UPI0020073486|nr:uncharacterized protein F4807DRAFT_328077 [Annulohypoxylon truncatum]KAI1204604.1 hypothetical protein F4807DRAFT_328077 [Annulohypoxylon truncatum]